MNSKSFHLVFLCFFGVQSFSLSELKSSKKNQNGLNQQGLQSALLSIEERLRNLDSVYSTQYTSSLEGKLNQFTRKLESFDAKMSRLEAIMHMEMDKISENISSQSFKEDIAKDHLLRKIDTVYDRINHRLVYLELKMEMNEKKLQDKIQLVLSRQQKLEESLISREADMQLEIGDAIAAIDDTKITCAVVEDQMKNMSKMLNDTAEKSSTNMETLLKDKLKNLEDGVFHQLDLMEDNLLNEIDNLNRTIQTASNSKNDFQEEINDYANKLSDMFTNLWDSNKKMENSVNTISNMQNLTRNDLQNGMRNILMQIGKKPVTQGPDEMTPVDESKLEEISQKMESNFEMIKDQQNQFLESCHRVQMDESQLESQLGSVLEKLIDVFEERTATEKKEMRNLEHVIKVHDGNIRKSNHQLTSNIMTLNEELENNHKSLEDALKSIQYQINDVIGLVQDQSKGENLESIKSKLEVISTGISTLNSTMHNFNLGSKVDVIPNSTEEIITEIPPNNHTTTMSDYENFQDIIEEVLGNQHRNNSTGLIYDMDLRIAPTKNSDNTNARLNGIGDNFQN